MLNDQGDLAVAELVFWVPATILGVLVCYRHGFGRQVGWLSIVLLGLARIIGASCTIAAEQQTHPDSSLLEAAGITNSIGLSFLISVLIGLLNRVADGTKIPMLPPRILQLLQLVLLVGIILGIVGGVKLSDGGDVSTAESLLKASTILFGVALAAVSAGLVITTIHLKQVPVGERRLVLACWLSLPFVWIRLVYSLLDVFLENATFNYYDPSVWVRAFMAVLEEFIVAIIVIATGFLTQKIPRDQVKGGGNKTKSYDTQLASSEQSSQQTQGYVYGPSTEQAGFHAQQS